MPDVDVTEVVLDPEIAGERFVVIRRQEVVNDKGRSVLTTTQAAAVGSVTPTGDNSLVREEAFSAQLNSILVITPFRLRGVSKDGQGRTFQPDLVLWKGQHYIVRSLNEYDRYGAGLIEAECVAFDYQERAADPALNQI